MSSAPPEGCVDLVRLTEAMEHAAGRFRGCGLFLAVLGPDGRVLAHDESGCVEARRLALSYLRGQAGGAADPGGELVRLPVSGPAGAEMAGVVFSVGGCRVAVVGRTPRGLDEPGMTVTPEMLAALAPAVRGTMVDRLGVGQQARQLDGLTLQLADNYEELSLLYQVSGGMKVNRDPEDFFRGLCKDVSGVLGTRSLGACLRTGRGLPNRLIVTGDLPLDPPMLSRFIDETFERLVDAATGHGLGPHAGESSYADASSPGGTMLLTELGADPSLAWLAGRVRQVLAAPLVRGGQVLGFLFAVDRESGAFDSVDAKLLTSVAGVSAIYVENVLLYDDVHGLLMGLLHSLTSAVDAKDSYTCGHSERVALIARELALAAGFDDVEAERVYIAGLLHDVGKIGVPEGVLRKCGKLTEAEVSAMKQHPEIGARILADVRQVQDIIPGVLHHHERFDGRGYPYGLSGTEIPVLGRVIGLADALDAMTSNRTYRRGMPIRQALDEIRKCAGTQFDPVLAEALVGIGSDRLTELLEQHRNQCGRDFQQALRHARAA